MVKIGPTQPRYWRSLPLEGRSGSVVFATLFLSSSNLKIATLLESPYPTPAAQPQQARYSICAGDPRMVNGCPQIWTPPIGQVLPFLLQLLGGREQGAGSREQGRWGVDAPASSRRVGERGRWGDGEMVPDESLPFTGGWLGWLGYDLAWEIERLPRLKKDPLPFPVAFWYEPDCFAVLDHWDQVLWLAASTPHQLDVLQNRLEKSPPSPHHPITPSPHHPITPSPHHPITPSPPALFLTSKADYEASVSRAKKYIQAGDIFQANLSVRFETHTAASGWEIYQALQQINPSPFASYWQTPWGNVISCSPERLVQLARSASGQMRVWTRPIAGTRSRGETPTQDRQLAEDLIANAKERAEHIMLVDLERNDLGRVCEWGSVAVNELLTIERYSHVMHLVSNITGVLRADCNAVDLIRAMFPGGTITGCPKVRCLEIIEELEPVRRSLFYGSCGYLDWRGHLDLNILIRTLLLAPITSEETHRGATVWGQVGAGIVADSDPEREWYESLHKAQAQLAALISIPDLKQRPF